MLVLALTTGLSMALILQDRQSAATLAELRGQGDAATARAEAQEREADERLAALQTSMDAVMARESAARNAEARAVLARIAALETRISRLSHQLRAVQARPRETREDRAR